ncbi:MAG: endonuclease/exonuclease/phosphatase family protein [Actinomycetota bacterium]
MRAVVATFNIRHGRGSDGVVDLERTASVIRAIGPDLIALQELDHNFTRSGRVDQPAMLAELIGMQISFFPTVVDGNRSYGLALAAREALDDARFEPLPRIAREEPRGVVLGRWSGVTVLATHLSTERWARAAQTRALARLARDAPPPVVILGDLNQRSWSWALVALRAAGLRGDRSWGGRARALGRIDHVLAGRGARVVRTWARHSEASDHPAIGAVVEAP